MRHSFLDPSHHHDDGSFGGERLISERREAEGKCDGNAGKNQACHDAYEEDQEIEVAKVFQYRLQEVKTANDERARSNGDGDMTPASGFDQPDQADHDHDGETGGENRPP